MGHKLAKKKYQFYSEVDGWASVKSLKAELAYNPLRLFQWPGRWLAAWMKARKDVANERARAKSIAALSAEMGEKTVGSLVKPLAMYLPQFHAIPENDEWWGKGFTEWTNVKKAKPLFAGHYQPHVPHPDVGYYDLSDPEVLRRQAKMAKQYGLAGFCFYYYHFKDGKRLLEKPLLNYLAAKDIDFPFCYAWANENWSRAWNGSDSEVIMPQDYEPSNMMKLIDDMIEAFKDPRYIKVNGGKTPMLLVYRAEIVPNIREIVALWRERVAKAGFDGLYLVSMQNFAEVPPAEMGFDAATEFAGLKRDTLMRDKSAPQTNDIGYSDIVPRLGKYAACLSRVKSNTTSVYPRYKMCCPSWDNVARKGSNGFAVIGNTPELFKEAVDACVRHTLADERLREKGFFFINAWNEWGEGAHLEPDEKHGYAYLEALRESMMRKVTEL